MLVHLSRKRPANSYSPRCHRISIFRCPDASNLKAPCTNIPVRRARKMFRRSSQDPINLSSRFQNALFRIQLPTIDGTRMVAVGTNALAVTGLRPYEGWSKFRPRIEQALAAYREVAAVSPAVRIGLRYINRIVVPHPDAKPASFLKGLPETQIADSSLSGFMQRLESVRKDAIKVLVTQATLQPTEPGTAEFLLDIDTLSDKEPVLDNAEILHVVDKLHEIEGAAFEALITDEARSLFDGT